MDWVNQFAKVNNKFRFQLFGRSVDNLNRCYDLYAKYDSENTGFMTPHAFNLFLNGFGVFLSSQEIRSIKEHFGQAERIAYNDFIQAVRNDVSPKRSAVIDHCWEELVQGNKETQMAPEGLIGRFIVEKHPHTRCRTKDPTKTQADFEESVRRWGSIKGFIGEAEFCQFCLDLNACVPLERDEYFVDALIHGLGLFNNKVTAQRLKQLEVTIYEKVRQRTLIKKDEGTKSVSTFKFFDLEQKGVVDFGRFRQTLERLGCDFKPSEMYALFNKHAGSDGVLTYQEMCALLFEMGSGVKENSNPVYQMAKASLYGYISTPGMTHQ